MAITMYSRIRLNRSLDKPIKIAGTKRRFTT